MTKKIPLDRLREISRQRSIRSVQPPLHIGDAPRHLDDADPIQIEWPIGTTLWL